MDPPREKASSVAVKRRKKFVGCSLLEHFELGQKVGVGTFGEVLKAKHSINGKVVALKKIFTKSEQEGFPITSLREIKLLKNVSHPNVASLIDMAVSYKTAEGSDFKEVDDIYMVFPFMDHDLTGILENQNISLSLPQIKCYMKQLLEGIAYLHQRQIMHRDLKGANLLVNNRGELRITDFGLARPIEENRLKYTPGVVTRWYRPPELLLGSDIYNESIDIWGAGCIIAEMYIRKPLFGASSDLEQLKMLCMYCGTPTEENYPGVSELSDFSKIQLKPEKRILREFLETKNLDKASIDLIDKMLVMDPKQRITALQALKHEYFKCDPLPCLPSEIGQFESSHVYTVQQQKEKEQQSMQSEPKRNKIDYERRHDELETRRKHYRDYDSHSVNGHMHRDYGSHLGYGQLHRDYESHLGNGHLPPPPPPPPTSTVRDRHSNSREDVIRESDSHRTPTRHNENYYLRTHLTPTRNYGSQLRRHDSEDERIHHSDSRNIHRHVNDSNDIDERRRVFCSSVSASESRSQSRSPERRTFASSTPSGAERNRRKISYDDL